MGDREKPCQLHHEHHKVPVTALEFFADQLLLAGEGTDLVAYRVPHKTQVAAIRVFRSQAIHNIRRHHVTQEILVYGGSHIAFVRIDQLKGGRTSLVVLGHKNVGDWILDAAFSPPLSEKTVCVALITAHNALVKCTLISPSQMTVKVDISAETIVSRSTCISYCANISWLSASRCLIASGTAFGDCVLWSSQLDTTHGKSAASKTHYVFQAHEGSVFGVQISPSVSHDTYRKPARILASCSDDRSVRVWNITDLEHESPSLFEIQRETGFGSMYQPHACAPPLLTKATGHASRIWDVRFVLRNGRHGLFPSTLVSFGEDGSCITWELRHTRGETDCTDYELRQIHVHPRHTGKNIWSAAISSLYCATGGADGAIVLSASVGTGPDKFNINDNPVDLASGEAQNFSSDALKSYAFVNDKTLVATAAEGRIVALTIGQNNKWSLESHGAHENLSFFPLVAAAQGAAFVAGTQGSIYMYSTRTGKCFSVAETARKVAAMFVSKLANIAKIPEPSRHSLLVTTVGSSIARLLDICELDDFQGSVRHAVTDLKLNLLPGFIVTSFSLFICGDTEHAALGSRNGSVAFYHLPERKGSQAVGSPQILHRVHGKEPVTALQWYSVDNSWFLFSTGRDGTCAVHKVNCHKASLSLELVHQLELPFRPSLEGLAISEDSRLLLWGFSGRNFFAHDATSQQDVLTVQCGGRVNLTWAYDPSPSGGTFAWTQNSKLEITTQTELPHQSFHPSGHGREIKALAVSGSENKIIATGSEDTDIKLFSYAAINGFECLQTLRKHNTGIQHLQWSANGYYLFSGAGSEEFCIWRLCHDVPLLNVGVVCESAHPRSRSSDLRIMSFEVIERAAGDHHDEVVFDIAMAYSDSTVKVWRYDQGTWTLQASGEYLTACLTSIIRLGPANSSSSGQGLITTATDGFVTSWEPEKADQLTWLHRRKIHQNAILDVATAALRDGSTLLVTAGDDDGIGFSRIHTGNEIATLLIPRAHAAAVTALALYQTADNFFCVLSASIDQQLKLWSVHVDITTHGAESLHVKKAQNVYTSVADVSSMSLLELEGGSTGVLICGVGMDVWRLGRLSLRNAH